MTRDDMDKQREGIERLLAMATVDERFAASLYERRAETIDASGVMLSAAEQQILESVDVATLKQMVGSVSNAIDEPDRRAFLGQSAAALLAVAGVAGASGCKETAVPVPTKGIQPDRPGPKPQGIRPDRPPIPKGIRPDRPQPKATRPDSGPHLEGIGTNPRPTRGIRPDRPRGRSDASTNKSLGKDEDE